MPDIYLVQPRDADDVRLQRNGAVWGYVQRMVVRADSPTRARQVASKRAGFEGKEIWRDESKTAVSRITLTGPEEVIL